MGGPFLGRQASLPARSAVGVSLILMVAAISAAAWFLVGFGESDVAVPLWGLCGGLAIVQSLLLGIVGRAKGTRTFFVVSGMNLGLAAVVAVLAYAHSVNW